MVRSRRALLTACVAASAGALSLAAPATAKVYQIEPDGTVLVRQGGGAVDWQRSDAKPRGAGTARAGLVRTRLTRSAPLLAATVVTPTVVTPREVAPREVRAETVDPIFVNPAPRRAAPVLAGSWPVRLDGTAMLHQAAAQAGLHPAVLEALVWQESRWRPGAVSRKGAIGLTQLMPDTARELGVDPRDPVANLNGGARYLRSLLDRFDGDLVKALAAYNAGARRVEAWNGIPPIAETQNYVASILGRLQQTAGNR